MFRFISNVFVVSLLSTSAVLAAGNLRVALTVDDEGLNGVFRQAGIRKPAFPHISVMEAKENGVNIRENLGPIMSSVVSSLQLKAGQDLTGESLTFQGKGVEFHKKPGGVTFAALNGGTSGPGFMAFARQLQDAVAEPFRMRGPAGVLEGMCKRARRDSLEPGEVSQEAPQFASRTPAPRMYETAGFPHLTLAKGVGIDRRDFEELKDSQHPLRVTGVQLIYTLDAPHQGGSRVYLEYDLTSQSYMFNSDINPLRRYSGSFRYESELSAPLRQLSMIRSQSFCGPLAPPAGKRTRTWEDRGGSVPFRRLDARPSDPRHEQAKRWPGPFAGSSDEQLGMPGASEAMRSPQYASGTPYASELSPGERLRNRYRGRGVRRQGPSRPFAEPSHGTWDGGAPINSLEWRRVQYGNDPRYAPQGSPLDRMLG